MNHYMQRIGEIKTFRDRNLILKGADIATQRGWTGVPNFILESRKISIGAKITYAMLLKYARERDECFPGQDLLAKEMGTTRQSVNAYIKELRKAGLLTVKRRGQGWVNVYTVHIKASFWEKRRRR